MNIYKLNTPNTTEKLYSVIWFASSLKILWPTFLGAENNRCYRGTVELPDEVVWS